MDTLEGALETVPMVGTAPWTASLNRQLSITGVPLSEALKAMVIDAFWPLPDQNCDNVLKQILYFEPYFNHFQKEYRNPSKPSIAIQSYEDMVALLRIIKSNSTQSLNHLLTTIRTTALATHITTATDERLLSSIEFIVRCWLMINVNVVNDMPEKPPQQYPYPKPRVKELPWLRTESLAQTIRKNLDPYGYGSGGAEDGQQASWPVSPMGKLRQGKVPETDEFSPYLNVVDMERIAGFKINWTNTLAEHLTLRRKYLYLFSQVTALRRLEQSGTSRGILPDGLIEETLETMNLLIPIESAACNKWLKRQTQKHGLDDPLHFRDYRNGSPDRDVERFRYWRERLLKLSDVFMRTKPQSPIGWWYDDRDKGYWWNYWLVFGALACTVLFGLLSVILGFLQLDVAKKQLNSEQKQAGL
ncbi:hypothetical protein VTJ83DRAFT_221 [Remersonia thermophila]|uniref:Uncharacterized protein n=1 Tax=Remersonia thermophila TaxID=72144 RepID=A0ABR4DKH1_9PEZI